ncbi:proline racemase [Penicillium angulare]|uniref:Proline racemase n=1 Tax=Penicillium angulare TaxID=116970 RepID=A0A9W9KCB9_9EURO|nr:proline racemase [Penicillium angulare]
MRVEGTIDIIGVHCAGEVGDVIVGGVADPPNCSTMYEKLVYFRDKSDHIRQLLLKEPRGRPAMNTNLILPPCNPDADAGLLIMESEEYPPMSGGNTICAATVLLETGMVKMIEPVTNIKLDTAAGLVGVKADRMNGKCQAVSFDNVPAFVFKLDHIVDVSGVGSVSVDIAWGGMMYAVVDVRQIGLEISNANGPQLIDIGERIKRAVQGSYVPIHPENPDIRGVSIIEFTEPLLEESDGIKTAVNTVVVSPGRFDRCPCGTGSCARMAILHARGQIEIGERFHHRSIIGSSFECHIRGTAKVGEYDAVLPTVKGSAWIYGRKQMFLDEEDPFPVGFRVGDQWHVGKD